MLWLGLLLHCITLAGCLRVGIQTPLGQNFVDTYWKPTFSQATNDTVEMVAIVKDDDLYNQLEDLDLVYGSASLMNCLSVSNTYSAFASIVQFERNVSSKVVGGVIFVRADSDIYQVSDIRGKRVAFPQITYQVSCQAQWAVLQQEGIDLFLDSKFVLMTITYVDTIFAVTAGQVDVGFVRSGQLEGFTTVNYSNYRILNLQEGTGYQWPTSVVPQPTSVLMASSLLPEAYKADILQALLAIPSTDPAAKVGNYTMWIAPQNYLPMFQYQVRLGAMRNFVDPGHAQCIKNTNVYDFIDCPTRAVKKVRPCANRFPSTYTCITNPCVVDDLRLQVWVPIVVYVCLLTAGCALLVVALRHKKGVIQNCDPQQLTVGDEVVGHSKFGPVVKGTYHKSPVVVKRISRAGDRSRVYHINRLIKEGTDLYHRNVLPVLGSTTYKNSIAVVLPYKWFTLDDIIYNRMVPLSPYQKTGIIRDIVTGLAYLHENKIYGRRLVPPHLFVQDSWSVLIGISFSEKPQSSWHDAPELQDGRPDTAQSDIYALGMLMYEVMHRKPPFRQAKLQTLDAYAQVVVDIIKKCWAIQPDARPSITQIQDTLLQQHPGSLGDEFMQDRTRNRDLLKQRLPYQVSLKIQNNMLVHPTPHDQVTLLSVSMAETWSRQPTDFLHMHQKVKRTVEEIAAANNVVLLRTVDHSFMLVSNLHVPQPDHVGRVLTVACELSRISRTLKLQVGQNSVACQLRMGIKSGPAMAMVLGRDPPHYCLIGKSVVEACYLQETCEPHHIQSCEHIDEHIKRLPFEVTLRVNYIPRFSPDAPMLQTLLFSVFSSTSITWTNEGRS